MGKNEGGVQSECPDTCASRCKHLNRPAYAPVATHNHTVSVTDLEYLRLARFGRALKRSLAVTFVFVLSDSEPP